MAVTVQPPGPKVRITGPLQVGGVRENLDHRKRKKKKEEEERKETTALHNDQVHYDVYRGVPCITLRCHKEAKAFVHLTYLHNDGLKKKTTAALI